MARFFFNCTGGNTYSSGRTDYFDNSSYFQGNRGDGFGNLRSIVIFNSTDIRTRLANYRITACYLDFHVTDLDGTQARIYIGTHNYTAPPSIWESSRVNQNRVVLNKVGAGRVIGLSLGTTIGTELKDGASAGIAFGPVDTVNDNDYEARANIAPNGALYEPVLTIDAEILNVAPNAPTLTEPAASAIVDIANNGASFRWSHSDPNGDAMAGWRFRRKLPNGTFEWWNGSNFVSTETNLTTGLVNGALVIPPLKWGNGLALEWSVATADSLGQWGPYSSARILYSSAPPVSAVVEPTLRANSPRPTVRWTYSDPDGTPQFGWAAQVVPPGVYNSPGWEPDNYLGVIWSSSASSAALAAAVSVDLVNHRTYRAYVKVASSPNPAGGLQWSPWTFSTFDVVVPPFPPAIQYPQNGSVADLGVGFTLSWQNSYFSNIGSQTGFAIRRLVSGGAYQWWNGSAWIGTETFLAGSSSSYAFRANEIANGVVYTFSVAIRDDYNEVSQYSNGSTVEASSAAQVTVLTPLGTVGLVNPIVTWSVFDVENDTQQTYQVRVIPSYVYDPGTTFNPLLVDAVWDSGEQVGESVRTTTIETDLDNAGRYRAYVRVRTNGVYSGWSYGEFSVSIVPPGTPSATAKVIQTEGAIDIIVQGRDNMLSEDSARSFKDWVPLENSAVSNAVYYESAQSSFAVGVRSLSPGTMTARTTEFWAVAPGQRYTGATTILAQLGADPVPSYTSIEFLDVDGTITAVASDSPASDETAIRSVATGIAPQDASYARLRVTFQNVIDGDENHLFYDPVLRPSVGSEWSPGGTLGNTFVSVIERNDNRKVRYGQNVPLPTDSQQAIIRDYEAPSGRQQDYEVTTRAVYPSATLVSSVLAVEPVRWVSGYLWLSDPLRRGSGREFGPQSFSAITRPVRQGKFRPIGRPDAIVTTGVRGLREGSFTIVTDTREERNAFTELVDRSGVILLRIPPDRGEDEGETIYVRLEGDAPEDRPLQHRTPHRTITQNWTEQLNPDSNYEYVPFE